MPAARILVVDDEPDIVHVVSRALSKKGFDVLSALDPAAALNIVREIAEGRGSPINLILSDVMMPRMSGPELVAEVQRLSPSTTALFISGYSCEGILPARAHFLGKPFTMQKLVSKVGELLENTNCGAGA
jgi:two-component system, cell cycle sensor histidine kinase and response regulator CckA